MISHGSFHASRASGTEPAPAIAWNIATIVRSSLIPCCKSTHT